jgi:hypothetical protein
VELWSREIKRADIITFLHNTKLEGRDAVFSASILILSQHHLLSLLHAYLNMDNNALNREYGGRLKILQIEASAKRKLDEMKAANAEVIRQHEAAAQRARNTASDPHALRVYTLQRYQKLYQDLEQEEEQRLADNAKGTGDDFREIDLAQQAYRNKQKEIWKFEELEEVKILRAEKIQWLEHTAKMEAELQAAKEEAQAAKKEASQSRIAIKTQELKVKAYLAEIDRLGKALGASTERIESDRLLDRTINDATEQFRIAAEVPSAAEEEEEARELREEDSSAA